MKTSKAPKSTAKAPARELPEAFYRIDALLRTMRVIAQHEDRLCTLHHTIQRARSLDPDILAELQTFLGELPSHEYAADLAAVHAALAPPAKPKKQPAAKKPKKMIRQKLAKT